MIIRGEKGRDRYLYDEINLTLTDKEGNCIKLYESLEGVNMEVMSVFML